MNVIVAGGTGFIGRNLCAELDERDHHVTALARNPGDADLPEGVEVVMGDVTAYDSIEEAFEGQDVAVNLVALSPLFKPPKGTTHEAVHLGGTKNVVKAAEEHGVPRLVQMSALGADPYGPTAYLRAKGRAEDVVRESDLDWTIVRPSVVFGDVPEFHSAGRPEADASGDGGEFLDFTAKLTTPRVTALPGGGRTRFQPIWVGDIASILADCVGPRPTDESSGRSPRDSVENEEHVGETYRIGGPEVLTLADVAKAIDRAEGESLTVLPVPMGLARVGLTLADPLPFVPMGSDQFRSLQLDSTVRDNDIRAFGVHAADLLTLSEYLERK